MDFAQYLNLKPIPVVTERKERHLCFAGFALVTLLVAILLSSPLAAAPQIISQPSGVSALVGTAVQLSIQATGSGISYQWRKNGVNLSGATASALSLPAISDADDGIYSVFASDSTGSVESRSVWVDAYKLQTAGQLDATFNCVSGVSNWVNTVDSIAEQQDGKLVVAGGFSLAQGVPSSMVARLTASGDFDPSFQVGSGGNGDAFTVLVQTDGKIILGGQFSKFNGSTVNCLVRLNSDGSIDSTFASPASVDNFVRCAVIQPDGKIIIGGRFSKGVKRLNTNGSEDTSFNPSSGANSDVDTVALTANGHLVVGGLFTLFNGARAGGVVQLNADGTPDSSSQIGTGALGFSGQSGNVLCSLVQPDGKIILSGGFTVFNGTLRPGLVRLNSNGSVDQAFSPAAGTGFAIALQPDSRVIVGTSFGVSRLLVDGSPDSSFVGGPTRGTVYATQLLHDGELIVGGGFNMFGSFQCGSLVKVTTAYPPQAPTITSQPGNVQPSIGSSVQFSVGAAGTAPLTYQWTKNGVAISGATGANLAISNVQNSDSGSYSVTITNSVGSVTSNAAVLVIAILPTVVTQPVSQTVNAGTAASFSVVANGIPQPSFQWQFNGVNIPGATNAGYTISAAQPSNSGSYTVILTSPSGSTSSNGAVLAVHATGAAAISSQPQSQTMALGSTVVLTVTSTGTVTISSVTGSTLLPEAVGAAIYQWYLNGVALSGATSATLLVSNVGSANAGSYACLVSNSSGSTLSNAAVVTVITTIDPGRLINLSILTGLSSDETMTMGTVLGGAGTSGNKPLLARAAGPSLAQFGVTGVLPNPAMTLTNTSVSPPVTVTMNTGWGGSSTLSNVFAQVGAFPYSSAASKDSAISQPSLAAGNYTLQVSDATNASGTVIAELYDATPAGTFTATTPRLINVSVLKTIATGGSLTAGFVIGGTTAKTVLIRAVGPALGVTPFNIPGVMPSPQLTLASTSTAPSTTMAANSGWGGDPQISQTAIRVGAFAVTNTASNDAMLLMTLSPGNYTAQVSPASSTVGGIAIVEVYEVP